MKEIGGYIELDSYQGKMLYNDGIKLNCGRNALAYLIEAKNIRCIAMPKFMCNSCDDVLKKYHVQVKYYSIGQDFKPLIHDRSEEEYLYIVNFYGQLTNEYLKNCVKKNKKIIVDNTQAYFQEPLNGVDTLYSCRKYFGVADGAILYTDANIGRKLIVDESFERIRFLLGRYERSASEFYAEYVENNRLFAMEPIKKMSKLTINMLNGLDYNFIKDVRKSNFTYLHKKLGEINQLEVGTNDGPYMYPLYIKSGEYIRKKLQERKIYIPILWPAVFDKCGEEELEYDLAKNILPLPVDQRYTLEDMQYIINKINENL